MQFLEKLWKSSKTGAFNLYNRKKKTIIGARTKLPYYKAFHRKFVGQRHEYKTDTYE